MYCRVLACDFDGTGATDGHFAPELAGALAEARRNGLITLLVTGRVHEEVESLCGDLSVFDAVVAENGGVVCFPRQGRTIQLDEPPPADLLSALRARGVPFHAGAVVVGTSGRHANDLFELVRQQGFDGQIVFNRDAAMLLPSGLNKATGVRRALEEIGRSPHNLVAFGDAENDLALFALSEVGVAACGAVPAINHKAEDRLSQPNGAGVARYIHELLKHGCRLPTAQRHRIVLGADADGPIDVPPSDLHVLVSGDPHSGKSWLTGLFAERLLERDYRVCLIDPEGDHLSLGQRPGTLILGREVPLPTPLGLRRLIVDQGRSVVLVLTSLPHQMQRAYVSRAIGALQEAGDATGLPHWIAVDEAHYFFEEGAQLPARFDGGTNYLLATYRPSLLSSRVHAAIGAHLITRTLIEEERYFLTSILHERGPRDLVPFEALNELEPPRVGLLTDDAHGPRWRTFMPVARTSAHAHHARKYLTARLPDEQAFWFYPAGSPPVAAHDVAEFLRAVEVIPLAEIGRHLAAGDFSRWTEDVLADHELAQAFRKMERRVRDGAAPNREELVAHIEDRYQLDGKPEHDVSR